MGDGVGFPIPMVFGVIPGACPFFKGVGCPFRLKERHPPCKRVMRVRLLQRAYWINVTYPRSLMDKTTAF